ncbi:MAG TPA: ABC transporter permease subunit [Sedimentisphaerales bacterium]|nr:ABC transporter permease subunit [Sedimentisphaerales bacterium]
MLKSIIRKEILNNLLSYKFSIITILSTILILVSIFVMYRDYYLAMENHDILRQESGDSIQIIPPTPLGIFTKGLDENLCRSFEIDREGITISNKKQKSVNDLFKLFTAPDLLYVIKVILSLCAMLFAFDIICGEKETGTLRQSLSNRLKRPILIIGKWTGGFISFILPFFIAVLLGTTYVTLSPMVDINLQDWAKLGLFLLSSVIYLAVFFSLGLLISCLTHRSSTSLFISLFVWAILVFLIPNLGNILARQLVEIPTVQHLELKHRRNWIKGNFERRNAVDSRRKGIIIRPMMAEIDKLNEDYRNRFNRLVKVSQNITRISPAAAFTFLATDIMGTGMAEERRLKRAALQSRNILLDWYMNEKRDEKSKQPVFSYQRSSVKEILGQGGLSNFLILILFNILFFTGAYVAFLRYDVR